MKKRHHFHPEAHLIYHIRPQSITISCLQTGLLLVIMGRRVVVLFSGACFALSEGAQKAPLLTDASA